MTERELKYIVDSRAAQQFLSRCRDQVTPTIYDPARPIAYARTLYLDTRDRAYHRAASMPWSCRVRVREYAAAETLEDSPRLTGVATVELKQSDRGERRKWRVARSPEVLRALIARGVSTDELPFEVPTMCRVGGCLYPQMTTWYRRLSFSAPGVRITVDEGVTFCAPQLPGDIGAAAEPERAIARGPSAMLEVKLLGDAPAWLEDAMRPIGTPARFSKFHEGMNKVFGAGLQTRATLALPTLDAPSGVND